jgi:integrase
MANLTDRFVSSLKPSEGKQNDVYDERLPGLGMRISPGGAKAWFVFYRGTDGRNRRLGLGRYDKGMSVDKARRAAKAKLAEVAAGGDPSAEKRAATFRELERDYFDRHAKPHKASWRADEWLLNRYVPESWKSRKLNTFTRDEMERLHATIGREHGQSAANHLMRLMRCMWNLARDWDLVRFDENPCSRVRWFKERKRERFLSPDELKRINGSLLAERDWRWKAYFPLCVMLGLRRSELLALSWQDVDLGTRTLRLEKTKNDRAHVLPLTSPVMRILESLPSRAAGRWLFPGDRPGQHLAEPSKAWQRIRKRAGLTDVTIHSLRHTTASWMAGAGFGLQMIGRALNHSSIAITERYAHLDLAPLRAAMEANAMLMDACGTPQAPINAAPAAEALNQAHSCETSA